MLTVNDIQRKLSYQKKPALHKRWADVYYGMTLHTAGARPSFEIDGITMFPPNYFGLDYQRLFDFFLFNKHPRESKVIRNLRLGMYRPMTQAPYLQVIDVMKTSMFQNSNYTVRIPVDEDLQYIWANNFEGLDLFQFFREHIVNIVSDPNGYFVVMPGNPAANYADGDPIMPTVLWVPSLNIVHISSEEIIFIDPDDDTRLNAWVVNTVGVLRFQKQDKGRDWVLLDAETEGYYAHELGHVPAYVAGGVWNIVGKFFESWLVRAKAATDEFVSSYSAEQLIDKEASHPYITMAFAKCTAQGCVNGKVTYGVLETGVPDCRNCDICRGTGVVSNNPGDRLYVPPAEMDKPHVRIDNPDVGINSYHHDKNKDVLNLVLDSLNLLKTLKAQSGVAKAIDEQRLYEFIKSISDDIFGRLIFNCIRDIIGYRNHNISNGQTTPDFYEFTLINPSDFGIVTAGDLLTEMKTGVDAALPAYIRSSLTSLYVDRKFNGDAVLDKKTRIIARIDPLMNYTESEKDGFVAAGAVRPEELRLSVMLPNIMDAVIADMSDVKFLAASEQQIIDAVKAKYAELNPAPAKITDYGQV